MIHGKIGVFGCKILEIERYVFMGRLECEGVRTVGMVAMGSWEDCKNWGWPLLGSWED